MLQIIKKIPVIQKILDKYPIIIQIFSFGVIGIINALVDFSIYISLTRNLSFWDKNKLYANFISFLCANVMSFFLNKRFSFRDKNSEKKFIKYVKFLAITTVSLCIYQASLYFSIKYFKITNSDIYGKVIGVVLGAIWNFIMYKLTVFKDKKQLSNEL